MANLSSYAAGILPVATARLPVVVLGLGLVSILVFHPLAAYPGPFLAKCTDLYAAWHAWRGTLHLDMYRCHKKYGPVVRYAPGRLLINSNTAAKAISSHGANVIKSKAYGALVHGAPNTLTLRNKKEHARRRKILSMALSDSQMRLYEAKMLEHIEALCSNLDDNASATTSDSSDESSASSSRALDMAVVCEHLTFDVICDIAFGLSPNTLKNDKYRFVPACITESNVRIGALVQASILSIAKLDKYLFPKSIKARNRFLGFLVWLIKTRKGSSPGPGAKRSDVFSYVETAKNPDDGSMLSRDEVQAESATLIVAGSDTTSTTVAATLFYLTGNPRAYDRLRKEVRTAFRSASEIRTGDQVNSCVFLRACINEALRMSPPVGGALWREVLPGGLTLEVGSRGGSQPSQTVFVPPGVDVGTGIYSLHRHEDYFDSPSEYRPERWLVAGENGGGDQADGAATAEAVELAWSAFFPFSSGQRSCVGKGLAYVEATLTLAHILYRFDFCRDESMPVGGEYVLKDHVTSAKSGPWLRFTRAGRDEEPQPGGAEGSRAESESEITLGHGNDDEATAAAVAAAANASPILDDVLPPPNSHMNASSPLEQHRAHSPVLSESSRFSYSASTCSEASRPESALSAPELDSPKGESTSLDDAQEIAVAQEMHPDTRRDLSHILLIELLAIETQEWIAEAVQAERIIEIGPGNTLTNMMKKTLQASADRDDARGIRRQILSLDSDQDDIYYRFDPASEQPEHSDNNDPGLAGIETKSSQQTTGPAETPLRGPRGASSLVNAAREPAAATTTARDAAPGAMIPDEAIAASSVLVSIVGAKLKKHPSDIEKSSTIGKLTGGRSTRSNELVGDLQVEFGDQIPDSAAELPIEELCLIVDKAQQATGRTELGKTATALVSTMLSNTLPGTFGPSKARSHLQSRWRVGPHRQNAIFLSALPSIQSTEGRKGDAGEAMAFLDDMAAAYLEREGLEARQPMADSEADAVTQRQAADRNDGLYQDFIEMLTMNMGRAATASDEDSPDTNAVDAGLSELRDELGDTYAQGVASMLDVKKQRVYKSFWNWVPQDILRLSRMAFQPGRGAHQQQQPQESVEDLTTRIANRACGRSIDQLRFHLEEEETKGKDKENHEIRRVLRSCMEACQSSLSQPPLFVDREPQQSPTIVITDNGDIEVRTVPRMPSGDSFVPVVRFFGAGRKTAEAEGQRLSSIYMEDLARARGPGLTFTGKSVLVTGAGRGSIGLSIVEKLLRGGARVTVATRSYSADITKMYADLYAKYGSRGSELRVVPFNQGSRRDVEALAAYCCGDARGDGGIDFVVPFAVMAESNRDLEDLDSHAELAHRVALVNVLRLLGAIVRNQRLGGRTTKPVTAVLPLSPNHGLMGGDGLYSESKRGLEAVFARWRSEGWHDYMALLGVVIGWTRGTGIMSDNDVLAPGVEALGVRTFSRGEMAAHIVTMMGGRVADACQSTPLIVDLGGGLAEIPNLKEAMTSIRHGLRDEAEIKIAIQREADLDNAVLTGQYPPGGVRTPTTDQGERESRLAPRAKLLLPLPTLPDYKTHIAPLARSLEGMVDLSRVVVVTGFSELGPCGNSRTRWEMEKGTPLSLDGCVELAWMMGLIKHERRHLLGKDASPRSGWVDAATGEPVEDSEVGDRYREWISEHTGLRKIEPELCDNGYDPAKSASVHEVVVERDLPPFETSAEVAEELKRQHGNRVAVFTSTGAGAGDGTGSHSGASPTTVTVQIKAGATILVPKASQFSRSVAGQIPTGWSAKRYGIDEDLINQIDRATLYALVCTVEALLCSGIVDPYEVYQHVHISEVGSCIGSSMGGLSSLRKMHRDRFLGEQVQGDILQETFANTTGAWVNMLLMGSAGPLKTPVGACATSLEALDTGYDLLVRGKAKMCIVGGLDDFSEDVSREFGRMKATCDTDSELAAGRTPREMSRPTASSRQGFVESQGCGVQVLATAELALRMGLPIFGVVAYTSMAADGIGRSVPAPGRGILTNARERQATSESAAAAATTAPSSSSSGATSPNKSLPSPLLDLRYRRRLRDQRLWLVDEELRHRKALLGHDACRPDGEGGLSGGQPHERTYWDERLAILDEEARRQREDIVYSLGNDFWKADPTISPLRGSLATWGLSINDIGVASLHGTSTVANDVNEAAVIQQQMTQLDRLPGNLLPCVTQKWLTGHGKGAAGAWMINGCLQMMDTGLVPGNPNADDVEPELERHQHLLFPGVPIQVGDGERRIIRACSVTSFGFGQKGSQALLVHPRHLFATVSEACYEEYAEKRQRRWQRACRRLTEGMVEENMVRVQTAAPYITSQAAALLEPAKSPSAWP